MARVLRKHHFREVIINKTDDDEYARSGSFSSFWGFLLVILVIAPLLYFVLPGGNSIIIFLSISMGIILIQIILSVFKEGNYD